MTTPSPIPRTIVRIISLKKESEDAQGCILHQKKFSYDSAQADALKKWMVRPVLKQFTTHFGEPIAYKDTAGNITQILIDYGSPFKKAIINPFGLSNRAHL